MKDAERSIEASNLSVVAVPLQIKRGEYRIVLVRLRRSAVACGRATTGPITLRPEIGERLSKPLARANGKSGRRGLDALPEAPWQFVNARNDRKRLAEWGIEEPWEFRAALREFVGLKAPKERDKIRRWSGP